MGLFVDSSERGQAALRSLEQASRKIGVVLVPAVIDRPEDIAGAFEKVANSGAKGLMDATTAPVTLIARERIAALAIQHRLPMLVSPTMADSGGLLSYGPDVPALFKRAATLVDRILRGAKPADIPVEQVNVYELVVNLRTARALGIELPRSLMLQATRVIE